MPIARLLLLGFSLSCYLLGCGRVAAEPASHYELGVGLAGLSAPHYPGSDQQFTVLAPVPWLVYRSDRLNIDRSGARATLFGSERLELSLSLNAGLPVDSEDNDARTGMPDLDWLLEAGPMLRYQLWSGATDNTLRFDLPLRRAFSADDLRLEQQGWVASPRLVYLDHWQQWDARTSLTLLYGSRDYQGYFFDVDPAYATSGRPAFEARSGYLGSQLTLTVSRRFGRWFWGGFCRYHQLAGAANRDSPLFQDETNVMVGVMVSWVWQEG